jgi:hypothetical protein
MERKASGLKIGEAIYGGWVTEVGVVFPLFTALIQPSYTFVFIMP